MEEGIKMRLTSVLNRSGSLLSYFHETCPCDLGPPDVLELGVPRLRFFCACASAAVTSVTYSGPSDLTQTSTSNISL